MSKHTPGPWATQVRGSSIEIEAESPAGVVEIATVHHSAEYAPSLPVKANGRLIAAAPLLLAALSAARGNIDDSGMGLEAYGNLINQIDAALDAAEEG